MSVTAVAQAVYELATTGRLSEQSEEDIRGLIGLTVDEETGNVVPESAESEDDLTEDETEKEKPAKATAATKKGN